MCLHCGQPLLPKHDEQPEMASGCIIAGSGDAGVAQDELGIEFERCPRIRHVCGALSRVGRIWWQEPSSQPGIAMSSAAAVQMDGTV